MNLLHQINQQKIKQNLLNKKTLDNKYNLPRLMRGFYIIITSLNEKTSLILILVDWILNPKMP